MVHAFECGWPVVMATHQLQGSLFDQGDECFYRAGEPLPAHPVLDEARQALSMHYAAELGEPFTMAGLCHYRDGVSAVGRREARPRSGRSRPGDRPRTGGQW